MCARACVVPPSVCLAFQTLHFINSLNDSSFMAFGGREGNRGKRKRERVKQRERDRKPAQSQHRAAETMDSDSGISSDYLSASCQVVNHSQHLHCCYHPKPPSLHRLHPSTSRGRRREREPITYRSGKTECYKCKLRGGGGVRERESERQKERERSRKGAEVTRSGSNDGMRGCASRKKRNTDATTE